MNYRNYITKKRCKIKGIGGDFNIPYGTVCKVVDGFIIYDKRIVCAVRSQNGKEYFWGYDKNNPEEEIRRQETAKELNDIAPDLDVEDLLDDNNAWRKYGHLEEIINGYMWMWNDDVQDMSYLDLTRLLTCIKTHTDP